MKLLLLNGQEELEPGRHFCFAIVSITEIYPLEPAVKVNLGSQSRDVVGHVNTAGEVCKVELNLILPFFQPHRHLADEWVNSRRRLVI